MDNSRKADAASPPVRLDDASVMDKVSQFAFQQGAVDDPSWTTLVQTVFSAGNNPGLGANARAFLIAYFSGRFHVG